MRRSWLVVVLLLSLGVNVGILAMIGMSRLGPRHGGAAARPDFGAGTPLFERMADNLELEGERRATFVDQQRRFFESFRALREELQLRRMELRRAVGAPAPDRQRIDRLLDESARLTARLDRLFIDNVLQTRQLLDRRQERIYFGFLDRLRRDGERRRQGGGRLG